MLIYPFFSTFNSFVGSILSAPVILALWYSNVWDTGYFPINSNRIYANESVYSPTMMLSRCPD